MMRADLFDLLFILLAGVGIFPQAVLYWAQSKGIALCTKQNVLLYLAIVWGLYLAIGLYVIDTDPDGIAKVLFPLAIFGGMRFVIYFVLSSFAQKDSSYY